MAAWLRRWTLDLKGSACRFDSRHGLFFNFFFFMMMMVERRAAAQESAKRKRCCAGMSAANVGASVNNVPCLSTHYTAHIKFHLTLRKRVEPCGW